MPTYEYACKSCGKSLEVVQKFTDDPLTECPECKGQLRKVFGAVGISFKGSGFYKTDSRPAAKTSSSTDSGSTKSESESSGTKTETPAAKPAESSSSPSPDKAAS